MTGSRASGRFSVVALTYAGSLNPLTKNEKPDPLNRALAVIQSPTTALLVALALAYLSVIGFVSLVGAGVVLFLFWIVCSVWIASRISHHTSHGKVRTFKGFAIFLSFFVLAGLHLHFIRHPPKEPLSIEGWITNLGRDVDARLSRLQQVQKETPLEKPIMTPAPIQHFPSPKVNADLLCGAPEDSRIHPGTMPYISKTVHLTPETKAPLIMEISVPGVSNFIPCSISLINTGDLTVSSTQLHVVRVGPVSIWVGGDPLNPNKYMTPRLSRNDIGVALSDDEEDIQLGHNAQELEIGKDLPIYDDREPSKRPFKIRLGPDVKGFNLKFTLQGSELKLARVCTVHFEVTRDRQLPPW